MTNLKAAIEGRMTEEDQEIIEELLEGMKPALESLADK